MEPPYRPRVPMASNPRGLPPRPNYPGMMPGSIQGGMGMMGMENKPYQMNFKPQPPMGQNQILRQQLQARLVSWIV